MEESTPSRHRRRERRRDRATPPVESAAVVETTPATDDVAATATATDDALATATATDDVPATATVTDDVPATATVTDDVPATATVTATDDVPATATATATDEAARPGESARRKPRSRRTDAERSLRGIVGAGSSQVGVAGAMRARDAARPTAEDLAAAERDLVIVRRHYVPPGTLPGAR
jgi:hypothetical protein